MYEYVLFVTDINAVWYQPGRGIWWICDVSPACSESTTYQTFHLALTSGNRQSDVGGAGTHQLWPLYPWHVLLRVSFTVHCMAVAGVCSVPLSCAMAVKCGVCMSRSIILDGGSISVKDEALKRQVWVVSCTNWGCLGVKISGFSSSVICGLNVSNTGVAKCTVIGYVLLDENLLHFKNSHILHTALQGILTCLLPAVQLLADWVAHPF